MYYKEKMIDGVLNYRYTPNGKWIPFTLQEVTNKYLEAKYYLECVKDV